MVEGLLKREHPAISDDLIAAGGVGIEGFMDRVNEFVRCADRTLKTVDSDGEVYD